MGINSNLIRSAINYFWENNLVIDKAIYFTIIIGQLTIYGILLTFYQFVVAYMNGPDEIKSYLGVAIDEYVVGKNTKAFNKIISKRLFEGLILLEIVYFPAVKVFDDILNEYVPCLNFMWYVFVIVYFILFFILFYQFTRCMLELKLYSKINHNKLIQEIEHYFLKESWGEKLKGSDTEFLEKKLKNLKIGILKDNNPSLNSHYSRLLDEIFHRYIKKKEKSFKKEPKNSTTASRKIALEIIAEAEIREIKFLTDEFVALDEKTTLSIFNFYMDVLWANLCSAKKIGYKAISFDVRNHYLLEERDDFGVYESLCAVKSLYDWCSVESTKVFLKSLHFNKMRSNEFYADFCDICIREILEEDYRKVIDGTLRVEEFKNRYEGTLIIDEYNDSCAEVITCNIDCLESHDIAYAISILTEDNCTYIFAYVVLYFSIYHFRYPRKLFDVGALKEIWHHHGRLGEAEDTFERIKKTNIGHRVDSEMYDKLVEYLKMENSADCYEKICKEEFFNVFQMWVIKTSILEQDYAIYHEKNYSKKIHIEIINELANHCELMRDNRIFKCVDNMRYLSEVKSEDDLDELNGTFESLLLADFPIQVLLGCAHHYRFPRKIAGMYALVKIDDLSQHTRKQNAVKQIIKTSFEESNMKFDEYIERLAEKCDTCGYPINYTRQKRMRDYLDGVV